MVVNDKAQSLTPPWCFRLLREQARSYRGYRSTALGELAQYFSIHPIPNPLLLRLRAQGFVEFDSWRVPFQHAPLETAAVVGAGDFRQMPQQGLARPTAALLRGDVKVFEV